MAIVGKRFSKRDIPTQEEITDLDNEIRNSREKFADLDKKLSDLCKESLNSNKSLPDLLSEAFPDADDGSTIHAHSSSFSEKLSCIKAKAINFLEAKGLPTSPIIYKVSTDQKWTENPKKYQKENPEGKFLSSETRLNYVDPSFFNAEADSPEDMAMRAICLIDEIENPRYRDERELAIFRLGQLIALSTVYGNEINQNKKSAQASRKKKWAVVLAKYLVNKYPDLEYKQYWGKLKGCSSANPCTLGNFDYSFYVDSRRLYGEKNKPGIVESTFISEYLFPEKRKNRKPPSK